MKDSTANFDNAMEIIGQVVFEFLFVEEKNPENEELRQVVNRLLYCAEDGYCIVTWPDSQDYMEEDWFKDEAILETEGRFGGSAYFIPIKRILQ